MKNSTEYLKGCKVPSVSEYMSPKFLDGEGGEQRRKRTAWGNGDYKSIIRENMKGYKDGKQD